MERVLEPQHIISCQVDAIYVQPPKRRVAEVERLVSLRYCDVVQKRKLGKTYQKPCESTARVYRVSSVKQPRCPGGDLKIRESAPLELPEAKQEWVYKTGDDFYRAQILSHVLSGRGASVLGPPGTGNSRTPTQLASAMEQQGHNVVNICLTHVAASHIGGQTAHPFCLKRCLHGSFKGV